MVDLIELLRRQSKVGPINVPRAAMRDAADKLEALQRENAELRAKVESTHELYGFEQRGRLEAEARAEDLSRQLAERDAEVAQMREAIDLVACGDLTLKESREVARAALSGSGDGRRLVPVEFLKEIRGWLPADGMNSISNGFIARIDSFIEQFASPSPAGGTE